MEKEEMNVESESNESINPCVGDIVLYCPYSPNDYYLKSWPAIITQTHLDTRRVDLIVFTIYGVETRVFIPYSPEIASDHWSEIKNGR